MAHLDFPGPVFWIERGDCSRGVDFNLATSTLREEILAAACAVAPRCRTFGPFGGPFNAGVDVDSNELATAFDLAQVLLPFSDLRAPGMTTNNYERYIGGPILRRKICPHEILKVIALDRQHQVTRVISNVACDEPCRVAIDGPALPVEQKEALRAFVRSLDPGAIDEIVTRWREPLVPPELMRRFDAACTSAYATLNRLGLPPDDEAGELVGVLTYQGAWGARRDAEHAAAWIQLGEVLREDLSDEGIARRLQPPERHLHAEAFAWLVHHQATSKREALAKAAEERAARFIALPWLHEAGVHAASALPWEPLVLLVKRLSAELAGLHRQGLGIIRERYVPMAALPKGPAPRPMEEAWPRLVLELARSKAALAVAGEAEPITAIFDARVALKGTSFGGADEALRELPAGMEANHAWLGIPDPIAMPLGCDDVEEWWALDPTPWERACTALARL